MKTLLIAAIFGLMFAAPGFAATKPAQSDGLPGELAYSANVKTFKFHKPGCKFYTCRDCTKFFKSPQAAKKAGYGECKVCWK